MPQLEKYRSDLGEVFRLHQFLFRVEQPSFVNWTTEIMQLKLTTVAFSAHTVEATETDYGRGVVLRDVGRTLYSGDLTTSFKEDVNLNIVSSILSWMKEIDDIVGGTGLEKSQYQADGDLSLLDRQENPIWTRRYVGLWPSEISELSLDATATDVAQVDVTWKFDYFTEVNTPNGSI